MDVTSPHDYPACAIFRGGSRCTCVYQDPPDQPCTVCGTSQGKHGSYPTCASHPYTVDGTCQHAGSLVAGVFVGGACAGAECKNGCARANKSRG